MGRSPLFCPPAISPAKQLHARLPAAPPVSWQDIAPPRLGPHHPHALRLPRPKLTVVIIATVHVELAPRRCEAATEPGRGRGAAQGGGKVGPCAGGRIVHVEVVEEVCAGRVGSLRGNLSNKMAQTRCILLSPLSDPLPASIPRRRSAHDCWLTVPKDPPQLTPSLSCRNSMFCTPDQGKCAGRELEESRRRGVCEGASASVRRQ
jgi:hypothetical protein